MSGVGATADLVPVSFELRLLAEAVEQLRALPDRSETLEFDSSVGLWPEYFSGICHIPKSHSIAALKNGPSQSSSTLSAISGSS